MEQRFQENIKEWSVEKSVQRFLKEQEKLNRDGMQNFAARHSPESILEPEMVIYEMICRHFLKQN